VSGVSSSGGAARNVYACPRRFRPPEWQHTTGLIADPGGRHCGAQSSTPRKTAQYAASHPQGRQSYGRRQLLTRRLTSGWTLPPGCHPTLPANGGESVTQEGAPARRANHSPLPPDSAIVYDYAAWKPPRDVLTPEAARRLHLSTRRHFRSEPRPLCWLEVGRGVRRCGCSSQPRTRARSVRCEGSGPCMLAHPGIGACNSA
jgi:hypothetical protein